MEHDNFHCFNAFLYISFRLFCITCGQKKIENSGKNFMNCTLPFVYISILEFSESVLALYHMVGFSIAGWYENRSNFVSVYVCVCMCVLGEFSQFTDIDIFVNIVVCLHTLVFILSLLYRFNFGIRSFEFLQLLHIQQYIPKALNNVS